MKDKAGGCYGEKMPLSKESGVPLGKEKALNVMGDSKNTAPVLNNAKPLAARP